MTARPPHGSWTVLHQGVLGPLAITWTRAGLFQISWEIAAEIGSLGSLRGDIARHAQRLESMLHEYAATGSADFASIPVDQSGYTEFTATVVTACRSIAAGRTETYGALARRVGRPTAARAVGRVMASNRVPIIVPCHRVVGAGGGLTGYSAPGGLDMKRRLLNLERSGQVTQVMVS